MEIHFILHRFLRHLLKAATRFRYLKWKEEISSLNKDLSRPLRNNYKLNLNTILLI
jgi:hypothetical protein